VPGASPGPRKLHPPCLSKAAPWKKCLEPYSDPESPPRRVALFHLSTDSLVAAIALSEPARLSLELFKAPIRAHQPKPCHLNVVRAQALQRRKARSWRKRFGATPAFHHRENGKADRPALLRRRVGTGNPYRGRRPLRQLLCGLHNFVRLGCPVGPNLTTYPHRSRNMLFANRQSQRPNPRRLRNL